MGYGSLSGGLFGVVLWLVCWWLVVQGCVVLVVVVQCSGGGVDDVVFLQGFVVVFHSVAVWSWWLLLVW